jgi:DNA-binding phage protein
MPLETFPWDVLDFIKDDEGLTFLLNEALETKDEPYITAVIADIERAKSLQEDPSLTLMMRVMRAAEAIKTRVGVSPVTENDREAA